MDTFIKCRERERGEKNRVSQKVFRISTRAISARRFKARICFCLFSQIGFAFKRPVNYTLVDR